MNKNITIALVLLLIFILGVFTWKKIGNTNNVNSDEGKIVQTEDLTIVKLTASKMGVYSPQTIKVKAGTKVRIEADPNTLTGSMGTLIIDDLNLSKEITKDSNVLEFIADKPGQYRMRCANNMGNSTLIVE